MRKCIEGSIRAINAKMRVFGCETANYDKEPSTLLNVKIVDCGRLKRDRLSISNDYDGSIE